jgi:hypothetical protein
MNEERGKKTQTGKKEILSVYIVYKESCGPTILTNEALSPEKLVYIFQDVWSHHSVRSFKNG